MGGKTKKKRLGDRFGGGGGGGKNRIGRGVSAGVEGHGVRLAVSNVNDFWHGGTQERERCARHERRANGAW